MQRRWHLQASSLAYINDDEAALLKSLGGAGKAVNRNRYTIIILLKKFLRKLTKAVKKIVKSPLGKAAILAGGLATLPFGGPAAVFGIKAVQEVLIRFLFGASRPGGGASLGLSCFLGIACNINLKLVSDAGKLTGLGKASRV